MQRCKPEMDHQHIQNQESKLVLTSDAKPRLKWTPELHLRFLDAVSQLGGAEKATPKALMRVMGIPGLTLYHLKSHLQKYRLGKSQQSEAYYNNKQQEYKANSRRDAPFREESVDKSQDHFNGSFQIAQALQMQMDVQRKLHEQIEVQRHLQLRIEAQGKYLQSVLKKAQETLVGYNPNSNSARMEIAKAELSRLASMVDNSCPSSSFSVLTDIENSNLKDIQMGTMKIKGYSLENSLTSCESPELKQSKHESGDSNKWDESFGLLQLMDLHPRTDKNEKSGTSNLGCGKKETRSTISDDNCVKQPSQIDKSGDRLREFGLQSFDLNRQNMVYGPQAIDLN